MKKNTADGQEEEKQAAPEGPSSPQGELGEALAFLKAWGRPIGLGLLLGTLVFVGLTVRRSNRVRAAEDADRMLASGKPEQLQAVVAQLPDTPGAPTALLTLARTDYVESRYEDAKKKYADFMARYPEHPLRVASELNAVLCDEALGRTREARAGYEAFAGKYKDHYLTPQAIFGKARSFEQEGKYDDARTVYEDFIAADTNSIWRTAAETSIKALNMKKRRAQSAANAPAEAPVLIAPPPAVPVAPAILSPAVPATNMPAVPATDTPAVPEAAGTGAPIPAPAPAK